MAAAKETRVEVPEARGGLLVVDDEPFLREAVAASLRFLGFGVTTAETAADALRLARDQAFDLMILDVMLPDGDGFEAVRRLRPPHPARRGLLPAAAARVVTFPASGGSGR